MRLETYMLAIAAVLTGLMAGIFFTWSNAVKPGIGKLSDIEYLSAFQSMNRVILNPSFKALFMAAIIATIILPFLYRNQFPNTLFWLLCTSFLFYWIGVFAITVIGNIPLNEVLDNSNLYMLSTNEIKILRTSIEAKWNNYNLIRCVSSSISFILLIISLLLVNKEIS